MCFAKFFQKVKDFVTEIKVYFALDTDIINKVASLGYGNIISLEKVHVPVRTREEYENVIYDILKEYKIVENYYERLDARTGQKHYESGFAIIEAHEKVFNVSYFQDIYIVKTTYGKTVLIRIANDTYFDMIITRTIYSITLLEKLTNV